MPNVPFMLLHGLYYTSLGAWVGMMLMIAAGAPSVFRILPDRAQAGDVIGGWLKVYYRAALALGILAAVAAVFRARVMEPTLWQGPWIPAKVIASVRYALLALMVLNVLYAGWSVDPEVHRLRAELPASREAFDALHRRSVSLMKANLLAGVAVIFLS